MDAISGKPLEFSELPSVNMENLSQFYVGENGNVILKYDDNSETTIDDWIGLGE